MKHTPEEIKNRISNIGEAIGDIAFDYITDLEKENAELKDYNKKLLQSDIDKQNKIVLLSKKVNDLQKENVGLKDELNKAKVIINKWLRVYNTNTTKEVIKESEDFLKED